MTSSELGKQVWREVARVVLPAEEDIDTLPLYVDFNGDVGAMGAQGPPRKGDLPVTVAPPPVLGEVHAENILGRRSLRVNKGDRVSFATYFNAFPASYWRKWTTATDLQLSVSLDGPASVLVYRSNARGIKQLVQTQRTETAGGTLTFTLPLAPFGDGGWYWFDVAAGREGATLLEAGWSVGVAVDAPEPGTVSLAITTFNRADYCVRNLQALSSDPDVRKIIDTIYVADQGTQLVRDEPGYTEVASDLGSQLRVIQQPNLGGSGGFSRGMFETVRAGTSSHVLLLDDDVIVETEGIQRAVAFAALCRVPTIVGGHMFDLFDRPVLHAFGEHVDRQRFNWGPLPGLYHRHNLAAQNLRATPWMHRRADVGYNGWWMCLLPVQVIKELGLSLPVFIKWDDAEYGLRAAEAGYPTVSMPGVAVWHVSWIDKDDAVDWQAYFHARNRILAALLHSPFKGGGRLLVDSLGIDLKHLMSMQYYPVAMRRKALEDVLRGPEHLHATIATAAAEARAAQREFADSTIERDPAAYPPPSVSKPLGRGIAHKPPKVALLPLWLTRAVARQALNAPREHSRVAPEAYLANMDAIWWRLAGFDSAVVSTADGTGASWYRRDQKEFRRALRESVRLHRKLRREWDKLARQYREALPQFASADAWARTFGVESQEGPNQP